MVAALFGIAAALLWSVAEAIAAFAILPLAMRVVPRALAWPLARLIALPLWAWFACVPAAFGTASLTPPALWAALFLLAAIAWTQRFWGKRRKQAGTELPHLREFLQFELFFLLATVVFGIIAPQISDLTGMGERMRDASLYASLLRSRAFPFDEPWFSGTSVVYYVFGYVTQATIPIAVFLWKPAVAYQTALAACGMLFLAAVWTCFRAAGTDPRRAAIGALIVGLGGNAAATYQAFKALGESTPYDWWSPSRAIENTITEFPGWTATFGDLHPHFLGMALFPTLLAVVLIAASRKAPSRVAAFLAAGMILAWQQGTNTWETPVFGFTILLGGLFATRGDGLRNRVLWNALPFATAALASVPFLRHAARVKREFAWVVIRSASAEWLAHWGLFLAPLALFVFPRVRERLGRDGGLAAVLFGGFALFMGAGWILAMIAALLAVVSCWGTYRAGREWHDEHAPEVAAIPIATIGLFWVAFCEFLHLKDVYGAALARLNTVFKFYVPAWTAVGIASVLIAFSLVRRNQATWAKGAFAIWLIALAAYPTMGLWRRTNGFNGAVGIDALGSLRREQSEDVRLADWMLDEERAGRRFSSIVEAPGTAYSTAMRVSAITGIPAPFAWDGYGYWSIQGLDAQARKRMESVKQLYGGTLTCSQMQDRLRELHVGHVVVGSQERRQFHNGPDRLVACFGTVHAERDVRLLDASQRLDGGEGRSQASYQR